MQNHFEYKNIVITGGDGFIGSHLVKDLIHTSAKLHLFVDGARTYWRLGHYVDNVTLHQIHCWSRSYLIKLLESVSPDFIFHLRANVTRTMPKPPPGELVDVTFAETLALVDASAEVTSARFIHVGTIAEYGSSTLPFVETDFPQPNTTYGSNKLKVSDRVRNYSDCERLTIVIPRLSVVYGPYQKPHDYLIPNVIKKCLQGQDFIIPTSGQERRDPLFVSDAVDSLKKIAVSSEASGHIINFGLGYTYTIKEIAETINEALGRRIEIVTRPNSRSSERNDVFQKIEKAKKLLSWEPKVDLEKGIESSVAWYQKNYEILGLSTL